MLCINCNVITGYLLIMIISCPQSLFQGEEQSFSGSFDPMYIKGKDDLVATFKVNITQIYWFKCSFFVWVWLLDAGSSPNVFEG